MVIQFFPPLAVVMKQDAVDAVVSHNTVIFEEDKLDFSLRSVSGFACNEQ